MSGLPPYSGNALTFTAVVDTTVRLYLQRNVSTNQVEWVEYSINGGASWVRTNNVDGANVTITVPLLQAGRKVMFRGKATAYADITQTDNYWSQFTFTEGSVRASGNIMSLLDPDFEELDTVGAGAFEYLFYDCQNLITPPELPAVNLGTRCYKLMFSRCFALETAPELPAPIMAESCYEEMFAGCQALTTAPALPAMQLARLCYGQMFSSCIALTAAPILPATTMENYCYQGMFSSCRFTTAPALNSTSLAIGCYKEMFKSCTGLINAPALPATTLRNHCYSNMFERCTSLQVSPVLPAVTLLYRSYYYMFSDCTSLNRITALCVNMSETECKDGWVRHVAAQGTFIKASGSSWSIGDNGIPSGWDVEIYNN